MIRKYGNCINFKNCKNADEKAELGIIDGHDFVCPDCHNPLYVLKPEESSKLPLMKILAAVLVFVLIGFIFKNYSGMSNGNSNNKDDGSELSITGKEYSPKDDYHTIIKNQKVNIGVQSFSAPLNYIENGKQKGLDYDLARLIFSQNEFGLINNSAVDADHLVTDYAEIPSLLSRKNARGDYEVEIIMGGLTFGDSDNPNVVYTIPYLENFGYCLITKKSSKINSLSDIKNKKIGIVKDDPVLNAYAQSVLPKDAKLIELSDASQTWLSDFLDTNEVDAIIYDFPCAVGEIEGSDLQIKVANLPNSNITYRIGLRKGNEKLRDELNSAIRKIKEMPEYSKLLKLYLPIDDVLLPTNENNNPTHIVKRRESLSIIAENHLGSVARWREIQDLNNLPNPQFISVGDKLIMPADYK